MKKDDASLMHFLSLLRRLVIALLVMGVSMPVTQAEESGSNPAYRTLFQPATVNAKWKQECSVCHVPFAPGLLQAESWKNIMSKLDKHFGVDAALTAKENSEITAFLVNNASTRWRYSVPPSRISEAAWFTQRHSEHAAALRHPLVKSPANCIACHKYSENGDYSSGGGGCGNLCHEF